MFKIIILFALTLAACIDHTATLQQGLCTIEDQNAGLCDGPSGGWASLQQHTHDYAAQQAGGAQPVNESWGICDSTYCAVRWEFPNLVLVTVCIRDPYGNVNCATAICEPGWTCPSPPR